MNTPAIEASGLQKKYENVLAVSGLDLRIERGEMFGLVGADGAGKSTTIRMLCTLVLPSAGEARILGMDTVKQAGSIKEKIGYVAERFNLYLTLTVEENLSFFARLRNLPREVSEKRMKELLQFCRLEPFRKRQAQHLSGGMQKKLALACSLIHEPEVVFLDEPTTGVDPVSRRDFWRIIADFLTRGITVLVSTPYLDEAERFHRIAFMHKGQIIACDTPQNLKAQLAGELLEIRTRQSNEAVTVLARASFVQTAQVFGDTVHVMVDRAEKRRAEINRLLKEHSISVIDLRRISAGLEDVFVTQLTGLEDTQKSLTADENSVATVLKEDSQYETAIEVTDLSKKFGDFTAVDRVSFNIARGEIFGLLGPNGSGKTTTIRMITGLLKSTEGKAFVLGDDMSLMADIVQSRIGYMSQKFSLFNDLTVEENITFYGNLYSLPAESLKERKTWVLKMAGLSGKEKTLASELAGGWKQRLSLGCAIIHSPEVVFLDEPTAGVDPLSRRAFWELIQELSTRGTTIFITTHYMDEAEHCHRLGLMYQGKLIALGSPHQLKTEQVKGELVEVITSDYARSLVALSTDARYHQISLFGSAIHVIVDEASTATPEIKRLLESRGVAVNSINRVLFSMEDVFISLMEAQEMNHSALAVQKGD
ncbi:putative multidrug ABC transporter ATP-binding protein YbhF [subsurface metagenome]|nr:ATP-binding cassette domain-containing protein [Dehalococcoidia bacterium]